MKLFFNEIGNLIRQAVEHDWLKITSALGNERVYSVALVTDSDCVTLFMAANTYEYMKKQDEEILKLLKNNLTQKQLEMAKDGSLCISKWTPDEWGYSNDDDSQFNQISNRLYEKTKTLNPKEFQLYVELFLETVTSIFQDLIRCEAFGASSAEITYFISMSDDDRAADIENFSAKLLNAEEKYIEFTKRTNGWV